MSLQNSPEAWELPAAALHASLAEMAPDGARGCEGVALWLGRRAGTVAQVSHVVTLRGVGIVKWPDRLSIAAELLNEVTDVAIDLGCHLIGQIHSHPFDWVELSLADQRMGIRSEGYLSVVAPHFAQRADTRLDDCGVHLFDGGGWRRVVPPELQRRVRLVEREAPVLIVGGQGNG